MHPANRWRGHGEKPWKQATKEQHLPRVGRCADAPVFSQRQDHEWRVKRGKEVRRKAVKQTRSV